MNLHEFKELDFEEALDLLESRLIELKGAIEKAEKQQAGKDEASRAKALEELNFLHGQRADIEAKMAKLREMKAAELAGERDNLLTETFMIFDQLGERISRLLEK